MQVSGYIYMTKQNVQGKEMIKTKRACYQGSIRQGDYQRA